MLVEDFADGLVAVVLARNRLQHRRSDPCVLGRQIPNLAAAGGKLHRRQLEHLQRGRQRRAHLVDRHPFSQRDDMGRVERMEFLPPQHHLLQPVERTNGGEKLMPTIPFEVATPLRADGHKTPRDPRAAERNTRPSIRGRRSSRVVVEVPQNPLHFTGSGVRDQMVDETNLQVDPSGQFVHRQTFPQRPRDGLGLRLRSRHPQNANLDAVRRALHRLPIPNLGHGVDGGLKQDARQQPPLDTILHRKHFRRPPFQALDPRQPATRTRFRANATLSPTS